MALVVLLFALFASLFSLSKATLEYSEPFFLVGSRMAFGGLLLLLYQFAVNRRAFNFNWRQIKDLFLLALFNIYLTNILEIWGLQHIASSKACLIYSVSPFLSALFSFFIFSEVLSKGKWMGLLFGILGITVLVFEDLQNLEARHQLVSPHWGDFALVLAVAANVYGWIVLKRTVTDHKMNPILANGVAMLLGGLMSLGHSYGAGETWKPVPVFDMELFVRNSFLMTIISNVICYNLYGYLLKKYSATFMSFAGLITPLFASLFGWMLFEEKITWHFVVSFLLFVFGLVLFHREEVRNKATAQSEPA